MHRSIHLGLTALLAVASVSAPFAHTHAAGVAQAHLAHEHFSVLHAHIALPSKDAAVNQVDDSARRVNWFHFEHESPLTLAPPISAPGLLIPGAGFTERVLSPSTEPVPEESPPRAIAPRGPPVLIA